MSNTIAGKTFALFANPNNKKIISELENAGARVIKFPGVDAEKVILDSAYAEVLSNLKNFDWIIFTDVLTVDFFLQILEENAIDFFELDEIRVCAFGEIVSDRLRFVQLHADVIPPTIETQDVLSALGNYISGEEFTDIKFLLPKENTFPVEIKNALMKMKAEVFELPIYQIKFAEENEIPKLKALLKGGAIDGAMFQFAREHNLKHTVLFQRTKIDTVDE